MTSGEAGAASALPGRSGPSPETVEAPEAQGWAEATVQASAWVLLVLLPVHVVLTVLVDDPATTSAADVLARWEQPWRRALDWLVIVLGLGHAALGGWRALHLGAPTALRTVTAAVLALACALLGAGASVAIATTGL